MDTRSMRALACTSHPPPEDNYEFYVSLTNQRQPHLVPPGPVVTDVIPGDQRRRVCVVEGDQATAHAGHTGPDHLGVVTCARRVPGQYRAGII